MGNTTSTVGRLQCVHPDLGFDGGVTLEGHVKSTLTKISDAVNSRYFVSRLLANGASVDFTHNFKCAFSELRINLFLIDGSDELTRITSATTPPLSQFSIVAKIGLLTTAITVTNNSGSSRDIALVIIQGKGAEYLSDLYDCDTTGKEDGQALVYSLSAGKFLPGASGDASFKFQSINSSGTALVVKKGYIRLSDGRVLYLAADLTIDVSTTIVANGYWYSYLDVNTLSVSSIVSGRKLIAITSSNFAYSETAPEDNNLTRYIPMGQITRLAGVFTLATTEAFRAYDFPLGADKSLEYTLPLQTISTVGTAGQIAAGHVLAQNSFPSAAYASTSFYNMDSVNDENTGLAHNLTNVNSATFNNNGILGDSNNALLLNGTTQYLSSTDIHFDPGDTDFTCGGWFNPTSWSTGVHVLCCSWAASAYSYYFVLDAGSIKIYASTTGSDNPLLLTYDASSFAGWHHVSIKYVASSNTFYLYVDGKSVSSGSLSTNLIASGATRKFNIGTYNNGSGYFYAGLIDEFFFCNGTAYTDNDIAKIYASKLTHSRTLSPVSQKWLMTGVSAGGQARELSDNIIDMDVDDLYFDLSDEISTTQAELKLYNVSQTGLSKSAKPRTLEMTVDALDALLPITHGLGCVPEISFKIKNINNDYEPQDCSAFVLTATQIKIADGTLVSLYGTGVICILTYATANVAQFIPNRFWNNVVASSAVGLSVNDRLYANAATAFIATLPANPNIGDECQVLDSKGTFSITKYVTLNPGASPLRGGANTFDCTQPNQLYRIVYVDATYGWDILY
jgi:hypothetical protein